MAGLYGECERRTSVTDGKAILPENVRLVTDKEVRFIAFLVNERRLGL